MVVFKIELRQILLSILLFNNDLSSINLKRMFKLIFKLNGWRVNHYLPKDVTRCILLAVPHTSNWDTIYALATWQIMGLKTRFTIKKEWMRFPFKSFMRKVGALPIDRSLNPDGTRKGTVDAMVDLFTTNKELILTVTPEGTRSKVTKWKTGFYYVALNAKVPIALGFIDYKSKTTGISKVIYPTGDYNADMRLIMDFYKDKVAKFPENFSLDTTIE